LAEAVDALSAMLSLNLAVAFAALSILVDTSPAPNTRGESPETLYALGVKYANGDGIAKDPGTAAELFSRAAKAGHVKAQTGLCWMLYQGQGVVRRDYQEAARWCFAAAERGEPSAQYGAGILSREGLGCAKDERKALLWLTKAAEQEYTQAQYELGIMYRDGVGGERDRATAEKWLQKSADGGNLSAIRVLRASGWPKARVRLWSAVVGLIVGFVLLLWPDRKPQTAWIPWALMALLSLAFLVHELSVPQGLLDQQGSFWVLLYGRRSHVLFVVGSSALFAISTLCALRKSLARNGPQTNSDRTQR
jgi:TPR repeat protein